MNCQAMTFAETASKEWKCNSAFPSLTEISLASFHLGASTFTLIISFNAASLMTFHWIPWKTFSMSSNLISQDKLKHLWGFTEVKSSFLPSFKWSDTLFLSFLQCGPGHVTMATGPAFRTTAGSELGAAYKWLSSNKLRRSWICCKC